jgi:quercetin dioxygenase-like cupin family protein
MKMIHGDNIAVRRSVFMGPALVGLVVVGVILIELVSFSPPAHASQSTVLAKGTLPALGSDNFIFDVRDLALDPGDSPLTHRHNASMTYALDGQHALMIGGKLTLLNPGQASWIDDEILHTHRMNGKTPSHFLSMSLRAVNNKETPTTPNFPDINAVFESDVLTLTAQQIQDVVLTRTFYNPGEDDTVTFAGPTMFFVESGEFTFKIGNTTHSGKAGEYIVAPASTSIKIHTDIGQSGDVLELSAVPAGHPVLLSQGLMTQNYSQ